MLLRPQIISSKSTFHARKIINNWKIDVLLRHYYFFYVLFDIVQIEIINEIEHPCSCLKMPSTVFLKL